MNQVVHPVAVGSEGVGLFMRGLVRSRLNLRTTDPLPPFPVGLDGVPVALDYGGLGPPRSHSMLEHEVVIPIVLTFDCNVLSANGGVYRTRIPFAPYYIRPVLIMPHGVPDLGKWRRLATLEAVCCLAQNPWLKYLHYFSTNCNGDIGITYFEGPRIVCRCALYQERNVHAAYTLWDNNSPYVQVHPV